MTIPEITGHSLHDPSRRRPVLMDALNVAYWRGNPPQLVVPLTLAMHLLAHAQETRLYFDANARYRLGADAVVYMNLLEHPRHFHEVPSGRTADTVMLRDANAAAGVVISRDKYRDHRKRFRRLIDDPSRLYPGFVKDGRVQVPAMEIDLPLAVSVEAAWEGLLPLLEAQ